MTLYASQMQAARTSINRAAGLGNPTADYTLTAAVNATDDTGNGHSATWSTDHWNIDTNFILAGDPDAETYQCLFIAFGDFDSGGAFSWVNARESSVGLEVSRTDFNTAENWNMGDSPLTSFGSGNLIETWSGTGTHSVAFRYDGGSIAGWWDSAGKITDSYAGTNALLEPTTEQFGHVMQTNGGRLLIYVGATADKTDAEVTAIMTALEGGA